MIDHKTLDEINRLAEYRGSLVRSLPVIDRESHGNSISLKLDDDRNVWISLSAEKIKRLVHDEIENINSQLISLGFQPSPLDLKEGEKK
ncbi:MAG: hypothetical protein JJ964_14030 [Rhizobiales bacterium]|nr:hypothetical protein [Hyphomicrobiales bacterium]